MNRLKPEQPEGADAPISPSGESRLEFLTTEKEGNLAVLKCRTPGEAFLIAEELETADIIVSLPDDAAIAQEFEAVGFVSLRVSASSYEKASELKSVIERAHWDVRAQQPLSLPMALLIFAFGIFPFPGFFFYLQVRDGYNTRGFIRKVRSSRRWFKIGCSACLLLLLTIPMLINR